MRYPPGRYPLVERGRTTEIDWPFRTGHGVVARLPLTRLAASIGVWDQPVAEEHALMTALGARWIEQEGRDAG